MWAPTHRKVPYDADERDHLHASSRKLLLWTAALRRCRRERAHRRRLLVQVL
jgi:hypothetical protein